MNKTGMISGIADGLEISKLRAGQTLAVVLGIIEQELVEGRKVSLPGFGSFGIVARKARSARNPATGETIQLQASNAVKFTPGFPLKAKVNEAKRKVGSQRNSPMPEKMRA